MSERATFFQEFLNTKATEKIVVSPVKDAEGKPIKDKTTTGIVHHIAAVDYADALEKQGISKEVQKAVTEVNTAYTRAAYLHAGETLLAHLEAAKKDGKPLIELDAKGKPIGGITHVAVATHQTGGGTHLVKVQTIKMVPSGKPGPKEEGAAPAPKVAHYGRGTLDIKLPTLTAKAFKEDSDKVRAALQTIVEA